MTSVMHHRSSDRAPLSSVVAEITNDPTGRASGRDVHRFSRPLLMQLLGDLETEGITAPAVVARALELDTETAGTFAAGPSVVDWLSSQDLDAITGEQILAQIKDHALRQYVGNQQGRYAEEVLGHLLQRAVDALAEDLDRIVGELRPKWDDAAAAIAAAVAAGITGSTSAEEILTDGSDEAIAAWRTIDPAVAVLDQVNTLTNRLMFLCGHHLDQDETNRRGRAAWLDASASGPVPLRSPSERTIADPRTGIKVGENRSPVAIAMQTDIVDAEQRATEVTTQQRAAFAHAAHRQQQRQAEADAAATPLIDQPAISPLGGF